jgi:hypothetical protein
VNINGVDSEEYGDVASLRLTESGKHAYTYKKNGKEHANINGVDSEGHDGIWGLCLVEDGRYAYIYKDKGKTRVNINGNASREYAAALDLHLTESGHHAYAYLDNGEWHVNMNGNESRRYDEIGDLLLVEGGKHAYRYRENGKWHVNGNGRESETRVYPRDLVLAANGDYSYYHDDGEGRVVKVVNGEVTGTEYLEGMHERFFESLNRFDDAFEIHSTGGEHSLRSRYEDDHVRIDGKRRGHSPALYAWYDKTKNTFGWNAIEGKELVLYEYKLDEENMIKNN